MSGYAPGSGSASSLWTVAAGACELRRAALPPPGPGEVMVRATHGAVSRGTEALVLRGGVPPSEHQRMRCPHMVRRSVSVSGVR